MKKCCQIVAIEGTNPWKIQSYQGFSVLWCRRAMWFILLGAKSFIHPALGPDVLTPWWYSIECSENPCIRQGKDSPKDKNKTLRRETQGLIFLCRRLMFSALNRINHIALLHLKSLPLVAGYHILTDFALEIWCPVLLIIWYIHIIQPIRWAVIKLLSAMITGGRVYYFFSAGLRL